MLNALAALCFWCSPVRVECHFVAGIDTCYAKPRDTKEHTIHAYGLSPTEGAKVSGGGEFSWTTPAPKIDAPPLTPGMKMAVRQPQSAPKPIMHHVEIDGKIRKVKR